MRSIGCVREFDFAQPVVENLLEELRARLSAATR